MSYTIKVNGTASHRRCRGDTPLLWVLRDSLDLKGANSAAAWACAAAARCISTAPQRARASPRSAPWASAQVTTIEGIGATETGKRVQDAWLQVDVMQCGYCQAGQIMSATALLNANHKPTDQDIDDAMTGNLCRCATYKRIRAAIKQAAGLPTTDSREV